MRLTALLLLLFGCFDQVGAYGGDDGLRGSTQQQTREISDEQMDRKLYNMMMPGARVSAMDRDGAICSAEQISDQNAAINATVIKYYYAIESSTNVTTDNAEGRSIIRMLEDKLFRAIRPAILWCYFDESPSQRNLLDIGRLSSSQDVLDVSGPEKRDTLRKLTLEQARRLSIVSLSSSPEDEEITSCK